MGILVTEEAPARGRDEVLADPAAELETREQAMAEVALKLAYHSHHAHAARQRWAELYEGTAALRARLRQNPLTRPPLVITYFDYAD